jgi:heme/copper-type cytochrome/quinol oxidase subunit 2
VTTPAYSPAPVDRRDHGKRLVVAWVVLSVIATPLVAIFLGPAIPPGDASAQATQQVFDNTWLVSISTPVCIFVLLFLGYVFVSFRSRTAALVDGPPVRGDGRIQVIWMIVTTTTVLFLAGFGTYELLQSGAGGGQGPTAAFQPAGYTRALDVQVIGQQ